MILIVVLSVLTVLLLVGVLAFFLYWIGSLLLKISNNLAESNDHVKSIINDADLIQPGLEHINHTGGVVSGALPLLYGHGEQLGRLAAQPPAPQPEPTGHSNREPAAPAARRRRSRMSETVGYRPPE